jgi:hypothetical protein
MAISHKPTYGPVTSRLPVIRPEEEFAAEPWRRPPLESDASPTNQSWQPTLLKPLLTRSFPGTSSRMKLLTGVRMKKNQTIRNNATGETLTMLVSGEEDHGACQLYEVFLPPHRPSPPLHYRVEFTETFTLKQGNSSSM